MNMHSGEVKCPHCGKVQTDCTNGGDPREWWHDNYLPDGDCETECDGCRKQFIVRVSWSPSFEGMTVEQADQ